jgi:hypothetical protein
VNWGQSLFYLTMKKDFILEFVDYTTRQSAFGITWKVRFIPNGGTMRPWDVFVYADGEEWHNTDTSNNPSFEEAIKWIHYCDDL